MTTELSKRLREICDRHDAIGNMPLISTSEILRYADLIDQQAAEIADLKLRIDRWNSGDNGIGCKYQVKRLKTERDEWRRRAERLLGLATKWTDVTHHDWQKLEGVAQWFEEN